MTPFLFGSSKRPLFGVLHEPASGDARSGVLLCPPIGQEHVRTYWAFRQIASALSRTGHHVLRFDWSGVGDSAGDLEDASIERWLDDVEVASQELRDATGVARLVIVGMRLGAALAALSLAQTRPEAIVLWEPVWSGARYLADLEVLDAAAVADPKRFWHRWPATIRSVVGDALPRVAQQRTRDSGELLGMRLSDRLKADIRGIAPSAFGDLGGTRTTIVESGTSALELLHALQRAGAAPVLKTTHLNARFRDHRQIEELLLAGDALPAIVEAVGDVVQVG